MKLSTSNYHIDPPGMKIKEYYQAMINIEAKLTITDSEGLYFEEPLFTVVELADQLKKWLNSEKGKFIFETMDDDVENLLVFEPHDDEWSVYSSWENRPFSDILTTDELVEVAEKFISDVKVGVKEHLNLDVEKLCRL